MIKCLVLFYLYWQTENKNKSSVKNIQDGGKRIEIQ